MIAGINAACSLEVNTVCAAPTGGAAKTFDCVADCADNELIASVSDPAFVKNCSPCVAPGATSCEESCCSLLRPLEKNNCVSAWLLAPALNQYASMITGINAACSLEVNTVCAAPTAGDAAGDTDEEFLIPPPLVLGKGVDAAHVDWFKVDATASGLSFDDAAQAAFENGLASTLDKGYKVTVPVEHMVLDVVHSGSSISVSCAFPTSLESSKAVAAALNNANFAFGLKMSLTALSASFEISDVTSSKVIENAEVTSFHSIFGVSGPHAGANLALSAVAQKPAQPASSTTTGHFNRSALIALSTGGIVCVGLLAVVGMQARRAFASKMPQPGASAAEEYRGSITPKASEML
jgi:hypothetical protein